MASKNKGRKDEPFWPPRVPQIVPEKRSKQAEMELELVTQDGSNTMDDQRRIKRMYTNVCEKTPKSTDARGNRRRQEQESKDEVEKKRQKVEHRDNRKAEKTGLAESQRAATPMSGSHKRCHPSSHSSAKPPEGCCTK